MEPLRLHLPKDEHARLARWAEAEYPREACGLVLGTRAGTSARVERVVRGANLLAAADRFELDPGVVVSMDREARSRGQAILGAWHSHPDHEALPSEIDRDAAWPGWSCLIVPVTSEGAGNPRSWRLLERSWIEEDVR